MTTPTPEDRNAAYLKLKADRHKWARQVDQAAYDKYWEHRNKVLVRTPQVPPSDS